MRDSQDAEAAGAVAHQRVARAAALQLVVAIAEEHEVAVVHPREQRAGFAGVGLRHRQSARDRVRWRPRGRARASRGNRRRPGARLRARRGRGARARRPPRSSRGRSISIICQDSSCESRVDADGLEHAARIAAHRQHRVDDEMDGDVHLAEHDADGIHEEGHVRGHHAQQRAMRRGGCIGGERRGDVDEHAIAACAGGRIPGARAPRRPGPTARCARRSSSATPRKKARRKSPGQRAPRAGHALQCVRDYLLDEREARGGDLAEHR